MKTEQKNREIIINDFPTSKLPQEHKRRVTYTVCRELADTFSEPGNLFCVVGMMVKVQANTGKKYEFTIKDASGLITAYLPLSIECSWTHNLM